MPTDGGTWASSRFAPSRFPIPQHWISLCNAEGVEVLWIEDLEAVPAATRKLLVEELSRREFMPVIQRIVNVSSNTDPSQWEVETDRGTDPVPAEKRGRRAPRRPARRDPGRLGRDALSGARHATARLGWPARVGKIYVGDEQFAEPPGHYAFADPRELSLRILRLPGARY